MALPKSADRAKYLIRRMCARIADKYGNAGAYKFGESLVDPVIISCVMLGMTGHAQAPDVGYGFIRNHYTVLADAYPNLRLSKCRARVLLLFSLYDSINRLLG